MSRMKFKTGLIHIYTGNGKGKTTAALGLAVRAAGSGLKVMIHQFLKNGRYGELKALKNIPYIAVKQCGRKYFIEGEPESEDIDCAEKGLRAARRDIDSSRYDLVILDEINVALKLGLIKTKDVVSLLNSKPTNVEIVLTGRGAPEAILKKADLITEMKEVMHPYRKGISARKGIEY